MDSYFKDENIIVVEEPLKKYEKTYTRFSKNSMIVDDQLYAIVAANRAGLTTVLKVNDNKFSNHQTEDETPDYYVREPLEILDLTPIKGLYHS